MFVWEWEVEDIKRPSTNLYLLRAQPTDLSNFLTNVEGLYQPGYEIFEDKKKILHMNYLCIPTGVNWT